jgi:hypothetical protein
MWTLWLFPLIGIIFFSILAFVIIAAIFGQQRGAGTWLAFTLAPFGCALMPIAAIMLISVITDILQKSDAMLFHEVYGFRPEMREDQMLSDDFGIWSNRSIYMKLKATPHDRRRILDVINQRSELTAEQFTMLGTAKGFSWWESICEKPSIYNSDGYREWQTLTVYDCPERQIIFIVAFRP